MNKKQRSLFIVLDGLDGCGKGTQVKRLANYLFDKDKANHICLTREPYRSKYTKEIRKILKKNKNPKDSAMILTVLFVKDRKVHERLIRLHLKDGSHVVCDRYKYSTLAYQQTQGISLRKLIAMHKGVLIPDLVLLIDIPAEAALKRIAKDKKRGYKEVFEQLGFQKQLRKNYLALKRQLPRERIVVINGNRPPEAVFKSVCREVDKIL